MFLKQVLKKFMTKLLRSWASSTRFYKCALGLPGCTSCSIKTGSHRCAFLFDFSFLYFTYEWGENK